MTDREKIMTALDSMSLEQLSELYLHVLKIKSRRHASRKNPPQGSSYQKGGKP